ncbi:hypothetical protein WK47_25175 [Burkholderia ubonensis]|nr:hypothetical protein WJ74_10655 [Burkholderia ubonensis]KVT01169.1 hypothetical protein WK47_25175 [Burkholderia ubonensis]KVT07398.1 hypothetical protein WK46_10730 [Burkholderia ubonensis]KVT33824.1 hypothetical protein WK50_02550 [Burkholderia ubonensis]
MRGATPNKTRAIAKMVMSTTAAVFIVFLCTLTGRFITIHQLPHEFRASFVQSELRAFCFWQREHFVVRHRPHDTGAMIVLPHRAS